MSVQRLYPTFHETFALSLPSVGQVLELACSRGDSLTKAKIRDITGFGTVYVDVMPRYARGCGLIGPRKYSPTRLGEVVREHDPHLTQPATLWLMHYHLSAPHGPGPEFWSHLVTACLPFGRQVSRSELVAALIDLLAQSGGVALQDRTVHSSVTVFLGSYTKSDGLGRLGLLQETGARRGSDRLYSVSGPQAPPLGAVAYALADYWEANYGDRTTISLSSLAGDDGFARVMWMDEVRLAKALDELRLAGVVDLYKVAPPHQVVRLWSSKADVLERLYV